MELNAAIKKMTAQICDILSFNDPSVYIYGSYVLDDFHYGWSDIDILVLTEKTISEQQADELVCLRQSITAAFSSGVILLDGSVFFCLFSLHQALSAEQYNGKQA